MTTDLGAHTTQDPLTPFGDLKGLAVHDAEDLLTGHVWAVLTETDTGLIRYLDVELDGKNRHVLVPVGHARLHEGVRGDRRIRLRAATLDDLQEVPAYTGDAPWHDAEHARTILAAHGRVFRGDRYYAHPAFNHHGLYAGEHPIVPEAEAGLDLLDELELLSTSKVFRLAADQPDIRGWMIRTADDRDVGCVEDLIIDTKALNARYVLAHMEGAHLLIPVGYVELEDGAVRVPGLQAEDFKSIPHYTGLPMSRRSEEDLLAAIETALDARNPFLRVDYSHRQMVA